MIYGGCLIVSLTPFLPVFPVIYFFFKRGQIVWGELEIPKGMNWPTKPLGYNSLTDIHPSHGQHHPKGCIITTTAPNLQIKVISLLQAGLFMTGSPSRALGRDWPFTLIQTGLRSLNPSHYLSRMNRKTGIRLRGEGSPLPAFRSR